MHKIRGNKWNRQMCKWIASLLTVALLINQNCFLVLAEESGDDGEKVCLCDTRCSADSVNEACPVCAEGYENCEVAEDGTDTGTGEEPENPGTGDGENTGTEGTPEETVPDNGTGEETENPDAGSDSTIDEETEDSDSGEDEGVNTDADTDAVSDVDAIDEENIVVEDDETENVVEEEAVSPASVGDPFTYNGVKYRIISEDENNLQVEVAGHEEGTSVSGDLVIPPTVSDGTKEYAVVRIGGGAFYDCRSLTNVTIPTSITSIGIDAFMDCRSLKNVTIPNGITRIEDRTFLRCHGFTNIIIPDSVTSIGTNAFGACINAESVTIPEGFTSIGDGGFAGCLSLKSVTIPSSVTNIEWHAFALCHSLESVTILNDNISIGMEGMGQAFWECTNLNIFRIAVSENITGTPSIGPNCFQECDIGSLTFLTKDGTTELSNTTTPKLTEAVEFYDAADGDNNGKWFDWKLPEIPDETDYPVTIKVNKDGTEWTNCGKTFVLSPDNGVTFITDLAAVSNGTYAIYDITGASDSTGYVNTRVTVEVKDAAAHAEINYYSVTFYDDDTPFSGQIVPGDTMVSAPQPPPTKDGYTFYRWATSEGGSTEFDFTNRITAKTDIYASWIANTEKPFIITASAGAGGSVNPNGDVEVKSGANQQFAITPEDGYRIASVLVDDNEVLGSLQVINYSRASDTGAENNTRYYIFENVTGNHTLAAYFETITTGGNGSEGSGGGDNNDNGGSGGSGVGNANDNSDSGGSGGSDSSDNGNSDHSGGNDVSDSSGTGGSDGSDARNNANSNSGADSSVGNTSATGSNTDASTDASVISISNTAPASKDKEPKTGYASYMEIYATIAMIAGLSYLLLYFADGKNGMTEEEKKEIVAALVKWAKNGSRIKKYAALAVIFLILVYYHSIGKRTTADWKEVYEK